MIRDVRSWEMLLASNISHDVMRLKCSQVPGRKTKLSLIEARAAKHFHAQSFIAPSLPVHDPVPSCS